MVWKAIYYARLNHSTISFFNFMKLETAASRWHRVRVNASKVGKGLSKSKDAKAQQLAFQHWIEARAGKGKLDTGKGQHRRALSTIDPNVLGKHVAPNKRPPVPVHHPVTRKLSSWSSMFDSLTCHLYECNNVFLCLTKAILMIPMDIMTHKMLRTSFGTSYLITCLSFCSFFTEVYCSDCSVFVHHSLGVHNR